MRLFFLLIFLSKISLLSFSQVPTKAQMQSQMQEAIHELNKQIVDLEKQISDAKMNNEDDETIIDLENQLEMLMKQTEMMQNLDQGISNISDNTFKLADGDKINNNEVPKIDLVRIKMVPDKSIPNAKLVSFIKAINLEVERLMNAEDKFEAEKIFKSITSEKKSSAYLAHIANSLWIANYPEIAIYLLGKACIMDIENANNLNNYASFLIMTSGEHAAIPILQNLNKRFPNNSTILNNIGQAWFGLGEMTNANRYLDSTLRIYKNHSEANRTKSDIERSEGKADESLESLKRSLKEHYTPEKEAEIVERGGVVRFEDFWMMHPLKAEPLGIEQFIFSIPAYPFNGGIEAQQSQNEWQDFRLKLREAIETLNFEIESLKPQAEAYYQRLMNNPKILIPYNTNAYARAIRKQALLSEWMVDRMITLTNEKYAIDEKIAIWKDEYNNALRNIEDCGARKALATQYLNNANALRSDFNGKWMSYNKQLMNSQVGLALYASTDRSNYLLTIAVLKVQFLTHLAGLQCEFEAGCSNTSPEVIGRGPLPDFDALNCEFKYELFIPPFTTIRGECNMLSLEFDVDTELGPKIKAGWEENLNTGKLTKGSLELGFKQGVELANLGPAQPELAIESAVGIEFNSEGITEVHFRAAAGVEITGFVPETGFIENNLEAKTSEIGQVEAKISWNASKKATDPWNQNNSASSEFSKGIRFMQSVFQ